MKAILLLADYAVVQDWKLNVIGAGWSFTGPEPIPSAIGLLIELPWNETGRRHTWSLALKDGDGNPFATPDGASVGFAGEFEAGRPPGHTKGAPVNIALAINLGPMPLEPGGRYVWELTIDGEADEDWRAAFNVRPGPDPQPEEI